MSMAGFGDDESSARLQEGAIQSEQAVSPMHTPTKKDAKESSLVGSIGGDEDVDLVSEDKVNEMMREQDADLLESMHYAASQVSQYSPGGTPVLRPIDRSLPMSDVPLMKLPLASTSQMLMKNEMTKQPSLSRVTSFQPPSIPEVCDEVQSSGPVSGLVRQSSHLSNNEAQSGGTAAGSDVREPRGDTTDDDKSCRRLLSGEVRSLEKEKGEAQIKQGDKEEETTASPISVAVEASKTVHTGTASGKAEQRRVNEALQFAEAVGEDIAINRDELRIIEDNVDDGGSTDSDDDDACEPTEIRVADIASIEEVLSQTAPSVQTQKTHHTTASRGQEENPTLPTHVDILIQPVQRKSKRPLWPFGPAGSEYRMLDYLAENNEPSSFVYKGICANPPEITKRGIQRGNYAQLHRKAWLEVSDKYHRYGKNLRLYYRQWESLGFPTNQFFEWLDSKGEAAGEPLPNLEECPRSMLDSDTVLYMSNPEVTDGYALDIVSNEDGRGRVIDVDENPVFSGSDGWIFVLRDNVMYGAMKITSITGHSKKRFHHSSFFGGKAVASAGIIITNEEGYLTRLYPHSGHYRPGEAHMQRMLFFLHRKGVNLRTFEVDTQQFRHVSREKDVKKEKGDQSEKKSKKDKGDQGEKKAKKVDSLHLEKAVNVACFLANKALFIGNGIFDKVHKIRQADVTSVTEALELVDNGGFWQRKSSDQNRVESNG